IEKQRYSSRSAGGVNGFSLPATRSGSPRTQPLVKSSGAGRSARFPSGAPLSTHFAIVAMSPAERTRGALNSPHPVTGFHGGMMRADVLALISIACGFASAYVISENGAMSLG